jgi:hypothetical protein
MARVTLAPRQMTAATATASNAFADPSGTASVAGAGNGFTIANVGSDLVLLRVTNSTGSSGTVSVLAGSQPSAISSGQGPITVTVAASGTQWVGPFESARVQQADGSLTVESSAVMTVTAFAVDRKHAA